MFEYILAYVLQVAAGVAVGICLYAVIQAAADWFVNKIMGV